MKINMYKLDKYIFTSKIITGVLSFEMGDKTVNLESLTHYNVHT